MAPGNLPGPRIVARMRALPDARWSCHSCGACCKNFTFGPVEPAIIAGLEAKGIARDWPAAAERPWYTTRKAADGSTAFFLADVDGACIFLQADQRCAVHALYGAAAKPGFCREFPYHRVRDGEEVIVTVRSACAGYHQSHLDGEPLAALQEGDIPGEPTELKVPAIGILPGVGVSRDDWRYLEGVLIAAANREGSPGIFVGDARDAAFKALRRTSAPADATMFETLSRTILQRLLQIARQALREKAGAQWQRRYTEAVVTMLERALATRALLPEWEAETNAYMNLLYRNLLVSRQFAAIGGLAEGSGAFLLGALVVRRAAEGRLTPAAASAVMVPWTRFTENREVFATLRSAAPALAQLFVHATDGMP